MAEIDDELMARVLRWCAEAGRPATPDEVRDALTPLSWDALLAVRAVLADPPPARPLGPSALVEIAQGTPAEVAAERERSSGARPEVLPAASEQVPAPPPAEKKRTRGKSTRRLATVVIRRARDRREDDTPAHTPLPLVDELFLAEGRAVLERWVRRHGARRGRLVEEITAWRRPDGAPAGEEELERLLDAHGLARAFERREREEVLHAIRAAGGLLGGAARSLGLSAEALATTIERLGISSEVERIRDERRDDLRRRATLGDRVRLLVDDADRLQDLGLTREFEDDVRERLREHLKALRAGAAKHVAPSFARTLGITRDQASIIAARFDLDLRDPAPNTTAQRREHVPRPPPRSGGRESRADRSGGRAGGQRPVAPRRRKPPRRG